MLMTRLTYLLTTLILLALNGVALWAVLRGEQPIDAIVPAALIINLFAWPVALVVAYRVGQVTGVEYFRKVRTKIAALRAARGAAHSRR